METAASFQFEAEGHTIGNALRYVIMKKCVFCPKFLRDSDSRANDHSLVSSHIAPKLSSAVIQFHTLQNRK